MSPITPCLWLATEAEEAANFYVSIFPRSRVVRVMRAGEQVIGVELVLDGTTFTALNGRQGAGFSEATSFMIACETQRDVDHFWSALTAGGVEGRCGWLEDRYGLSWQVVPNELRSLLGDPDPAKAGRAMQAMLGMKKLDIAALRRARDGEQVAAG